ncbi:hypothetical protein B0A52_05867 [Exophiala mesophila]|uniref:BZIP domain-containing protein n=1 Tax=Exophiala mesophila TaxID=212818 RepID=A0A438N415_EXOME|nr:hypothetical protein B0A52_05867 [Exophiala mesophila]
MASTAGSPPATTPTSSTDIKPLLTRQPSLCAKPAITPPATSPAPSQQPPLSLTSKEWVIPPRPKPGRKPATDTPPTKRKAQNRAAQRAFRERRAARVGELEEQMKQVEEEHEHEQDLLRATIDKLQAEIEQYKLDIAAWSDRCRKLESDLNHAKSNQPSAPQPHSRDAQPPKQSDTAVDDTTVGCGNCTLDTRCQCIDDAFDAMGGEAATHSHQHEKRPHSPVHDYSEKRIKPEPKETLEIDFTELYSTKSIHMPIRPEDRSPTTSAVADRCGFCSDGTPCICAEMAAEQEQAASAPIILPRIMDPHRQLSQFTPPPSEGDVAISIPSTASPSEGCASGPGTCAQCRADPNSTLFCKSLAASRAQSALGGAAGGCCGGSTPGGGCCQSRTLPPVQADTVPLPARNTRSRAAGHTRLPAPAPPKAGVTLTCADAYTTLSRHPAYERASGDIAKWLPKLHASDAAPATVGRPALEIDAANVMAVLKDFDRRFGQNK